MKNLCLVVVCGAALWLLPTDRAGATPLFQKKFVAKYAGTGAKPDFVATVTDEKTKCFVCHVKGEKKEVRNEYGEALKKLGLLKANYKAERVEAEPDAVEKEINAFLDKVAAEKGPDGKPYGDAIKAGKLPIPLKD